MDQSGAMPEHLHMAFEHTICPGCKYPEPADWCWEHRILDCPLDFPPRHIEARDLLRIIRDLNERVKYLENNAVIDPEQ